MMRLYQTIIISFFIIFVYNKNLTILSPDELIYQFGSHPQNRRPMVFHISPIGYRPLSGILQGQVILGNPIGACSPLEDLHGFQQDLFVMADDTQCLQSIKAKNIASSGGFVGLIRQNIKNTLHDKEVNLVHIPILELEADTYDTISKFIQQNPNKIVNLAIDFSDDSQTHDNNLQIWFSPTQIESYKIMLELKNFLEQLNDVISFSPHYILQSQAQQKVYLGCFSKGKYCPTQIEYEGKYQGMNIVQQTLRQIVIRNMQYNKGIKTWWKYMQTFYKNCLLLYSETIFMNSTLLKICSQNSLIMAGINLNQFKEQYNDSFTGNRIKQFDENYYLRQERILYIRQQIQTHPIALINKAPVKLQTSSIKKTICEKQYNVKKGPCKSDSPVTNMQTFIFVCIMLLIFIAMAGVYRLYIKMKMKTQIKTEVDKTLEQYYRYIETFEGNNGEIADLNKKKKNTQKSRPLTEQFEQVSHKKAEISIEMRQNPTK